MAAFADCDVGAGKSPVARAMDGTLVGCRLPLHVVIARRSRIDEVRFTLCQVPAYATAFKLVNTAGARAKAKRAPRKQCPKNQWETLCACYFFSIEVLGVFGIE
jgi:hypothetical protein